ncbi:RPII140-upstream gene protein [Ceratina calcarata]|uniref:Complex I assembly factor TIMMDC1, mitochondrial n=1 Tax=Ceratina calcarata TaxID=156304 RepID=A0AAJ7IST7_9HYME|nr:RPII140-upstream gene protein [Ceratina calcarata]
MFRAAINKRLICAAFFPFSSSNGNSDISTLQIYYDKTKDFLIKENGSLTNEAQSVVNTTVAGVGIGFALGGLSKAKSFPAAHKAANQATLYNHKFDAAKEMSNKMALQVIKGGLPYGLKLGFFCFMFSGISTFLYAYRGTFDVLNGTLSGAITGAIYKINMGLKGSIAGCVVGSMLGCLYGTVTSIILYVTGVDMQDLYESSGKFMAARREKIRQNSIEFRKEEDSQLRAWYEQNKKLQSEEVKQEAKA